MERPPPRIVRRLVLAPLAIALCVALLAVAPLLLIAAAVADLFLPGSWRTTRLTAGLIVYLGIEIVGLLALFGLWVASGFGIWLKSRPIQDAHYALMRWLLETAFGAGAAFCRLRIEIVDRPEPKPGPVLVFSRHAGPGNSMMLVGTLMSAYRRHPRIVMLEKLQWDPLFDTLLNRVPNRFISHDPKRRHAYLSVIEELARGMGDRDAFILFPEGKDFTPRLRHKAISRLREGGHHREAEKAEQLRYVLPPRHNGVISAIRGAPDADIVFVAHTVLEDIGSFRELWDAVPLERPIEGRYWRFPASEAPSDGQELIDWLYGWWQRIDDWIAERRAAAESPMERAAREELEEEQAAERS